MALTFTKDMDYRRFFDDFDALDGGWTITTTEAGAGAATEAVSNADGGILLVTNDDADDDADFFQWAKETFKYESGKDLYFAIRFKVSEAIQSDFIAGLLITDTTPLDASDGIFFRKDDGDANLDFVVVKDGTASTKVVATLANDTWIKAEFYHNAGSKRIICKINGENAAHLPLTNSPDDEELTVSFGLQNGSAGAKSLSVDYIDVRKER